MKKHFNFINERIAILLVAFILLFGCQKEETSYNIEQSKYKVPEISTVQNDFEGYFNTTSNSGMYLRNSEQATIIPDWERSESKRYKKEDAQIEQNVDILYTPVKTPALPTIKSFLGSLEVNGVLVSKLFYIFYTDIDNPNFTGYVLIYDLDGSLSFAHKYNNGNLVDVSQASNTASRSANDDDCDGTTIGCLLDLLGGNLESLASFLNSNWLDEVVVIAHLDNSLSEDGPGGGYSPDFGLPPVPDELGYNNGIGSLGNAETPNWWIPNHVVAHPSAIAFAMDLHSLSPEAQWLANASQETLDAISEYLNNNRKPSLLAENTGNPDDNVNDNPD